MPCAIRGLVSLFKTAHSHETGEIAVRQFRFFFSINTARKKTVAQKKATKTRYRNEKKNARHVEIR